MKLSAARFRCLRDFYALIAKLEETCGGVRRLSDCSGRMQWPRRGVYFFFEAGEWRSDSGSGLRIVRVGTHALSGGSKTSLWNRLAQHRGNASDWGGNHRGSIFRLLVGSSILRRDGRTLDTWGQGQSAAANIRDHERDIERSASNVIGAMPFIWLDVPDEPGRASLRGQIERNSIALLSNFGGDQLDAPSAGWLGRFSDRERVRKSGLWNSNHVDESFDPEFLNNFERLIAEMGSRQ